ncbi:MAG: heat-shock protein Hsp70 [Candidatus Parabeggiatoa sp. nov. 3]|nr:MAG: heat-shock protein Hsp70 [Gammaproteobacteria bacterium]RKZ60611.1 MAG: heat-shock protein Hsp70 [Gammaproteobacteria bacterium]RKZ80349.1 MAG: heat-shock protein Hsp70 [Gammaproteobacteria bacterium]
MNDIIVGIDLGTTNSEIAIVENGKTVVIEDSGSKILPSFVGMSETNEVLVGEPAKNQYVLYPERTVKSIKRRMGEEIKVDMAGQGYTPQEISAIILKHLKGIAEDYLKQPVHKAVITVPAYFSDAQRQATREAGEIAGLEVVRMINEPTAAALSYEADQKTHKRILVYDLGGGTFDVSVVNIEDDVVEVVASHGNNKLGGDDFDQKIAEYLVEQIKEESGFDIQQSRKAIARINRAAESAKRALSDKPFVLIEEEYLEEHDGVPIHLSLELARDDYEEMIEEYIDETLEAVHIALKGANLTASDIDEILLVGGSTRTPLVSERLKTDLRLQPRLDVDPDLCVATGAAIQGAMIAGTDVSAAAVLVDITPYTYGTSALGEMNGELYPYMYVPIIHKNSSLPLNKTEVFYTVSDNQEKVDVRVFQGEERDALNNIQIGEFMVEGLSLVPQGNPILLKLELDLNGILDVSAIEKNTGFEKSIVIDNAISRFEEGEMETAKDRIRELFGEEGDGSVIFEQDNKTETHHAIVQARALVEKAERMLDDASPEDREDMVNMIETINDAMNNSDIKALKEPMDQLSDILYYLES